VNALCTDLLKDLSETETLGRQSVSSNMSLCGSRDGDCAVNSDVMVAFMETGYPGKRLLVLRSPSPWLIFTQSYGLLPRRF
jgi:hypothetical protein